MEPSLFVETAKGNFSSWSFAHIRNASPTCFRLLTQLILGAFLGDEDAGRNRPITTSATASTMRTSHTVKAPTRRFAETIFAAFMGSLVAWAVWCRYQIAVSDQARVFVVRCRRPIQCSP